MELRKNEQKSDEKNSKKDGKKQEYIFEKEENRQYVYICIFYKKFLQRCSNFNIL